MSFLKTNWTWLVAVVAIIGALLLLHSRWYGQGDENGYQRATTEWASKYLALVQAKTTTTVDTTTRRIPQPPIIDRRKDTTSLKLADKLKIDSAFAAGKSYGIDSFQKVYEFIGTPANWKWNYGNSPIDSNRISADIWYYPLTRDWDPKIYLPPLVETFINTHDRILAVEVQKEERSFIEEIQPYFIGGVVGVVIYALSVR